MERGLSYPVQIEIRNSSRHPLNFRFIDGIPQSFHKHFPFHGEMRKEETMVATYETSAEIRGKYEISKLYFRYKSVLGLWEKQVTALFR